MADPMVLICGLVRRSQVQSIICNRINSSGDEEYLVQFKTTARPKRAVLSWQTIFELDQCLDLVQDYLDSKALLTRKRKADFDEDGEPHLSPDILRLRIDRSSSVASSASVSGQSESSVGSETRDTKIYNGTRRTTNGYIEVSPSSDPSITHVCDATSLPTPQMLSRAANSSSRVAYEKIRLRFTQNLRDAFGDEVRLVNTRDKTTPSLKFNFIPESILREGVYKAPLETVIGCQKCSPHMGRDIGCEYTKRCDCLEYAAVDEGRLDGGEIARLRKIEQKGSSTMGFPKRFPYHSTGHYLGCLVTFYLESRHMVYECNQNCRCGPLCNNRVVQHGRKVRLEIFKTAKRGFGLRCLENLRRGQFIDTYRGEVITDVEATRREEEVGHVKSKDSYLFSLDKFKEDQGLDDSDIYVIDGQFYGSPTRFINHSCEPNCRIFTVSFNKNDHMIYELCFFAAVDISAGTELTFDYNDKDDAQDIERGVNKEEKNEAGENPTKCYCGSSKCRGFLWI